MTGMTSTRRPRLSHRDGRSAVYQAQAATKEPLWRDLVAGAVFFTALLIFVAVVLVGGLLVFG
jgi:hypothetical protein